MEGRVRWRASPSGMRTKAVRVEPELPPTTKRHGPGMRAAVVYYLCRNHHLEHPHFMEVTLASPQGLYLRDVIGRLDALRGNGMVAKYSCSCKRSYKTGFVWHDLSVDDLLLLTQGTEYVLKGSEFPFNQSKPLPMPALQAGSTTRVASFSWIIKPRVDFQVSVSYSYNLPYSSSHQRGSTAATTNNSLCCCCSSHQRARGATVTSPADLAVNTICLHHWRMKDTNF